MKARGGGWEGKEGKRGFPPVLSSHRSLRACSFSIIAIFIGKSELSPWKLILVCAGGEFANTVFIRLNAAAFSKFLAFPMPRLFEGGVYFKITFLKSMKTVIVNRL